MVIAAVPDCFREAREYLRCVVAVGVYRRCGMRG